MTQVSSKAVPLAPQADEWTGLKRYLPIMKEMIDYLSKEALDDETMYYDPKADCMVYYRRVTDMDRALFQWLWGTEEIWIYASAGVGEGKES